MSFVFSMGSCQPTTSQSFIPFTLESAANNDLSSDAVCRPKEKPKIMRLFPLKPAFQPFKRKLPVTNLVSHEFQGIPRTDDPEQVSIAGVSIQVEGELSEQENGAGLFSTYLASGCLPQKSTLHRLPKKPLLELSLVPSSVPSCAIIDLVRHQSTNNQFVNPYYSSTAARAHPLELAKGHERLRGSGFRSSNVATISSAAPSTAPGSGVLSRTSSEYTFPLTSNSSHLGQISAEQLAAHAAANQRTSTRHGPRPRSSSFRGVTHYKRTGRWEAHIWNKGKQIYLGASSTAEKAARAYDRAAIHFRKMGAELNFYLEDYAGELRQLVELSEVQLVTMLRRQSAGEGRSQPEYPPIPQSQHSPILFGARECVGGFAISAKPEGSQIECPVNHSEEPIGQKMHASHSFGSCSGTLVRSMAPSGEPEGGSTLHVPEAAHVSKRRRQYLQVIDNIRVNHSSSIELVGQWGRPS